MRERLDAELAALNKAVDDAVAARRAWMDAHMPDYARHRVGETLYDLNTGRELGTVSRLYRYWGEQDDPRYDTTMSVQYEIVVSNSHGVRVLDNTSRQPGLRYGNAAQLAREMEGKAAMARAWAASASPPPAPAP